MKCFHRHFCRLLARELQKLEVDVRKDCFIRSLTSSNVASATSYLLQETCLSSVDCDLPTNCYPHLQEGADSKTLLFVIVETVYSVNDVFV